MNCEPWVPANLSKNDLLDLKEENFPTVFESYEDAEKWALETNVAIIKQTEQVRLSREAVEQAAKGAERYRGIIGELKEQKAALPELSQERRLLEEKKVCLCERERLGVLKFKERKALKEKSRAIEYRLTKKRADLREKQHKIDMQIREHRAHMEKMLAVANGCTGETFRRKFDNCVSFHMGIKKKQENSSAKTTDIRGGQEGAALETEDKTVVRSLMI